MTYQGSPGEQDFSSWLNRLFGPRPLPTTPEAQQREWAIVQHGLAPQNRGGGTLGGIGNAAASIAGALAGRSALDRINQGQMGGLGGAAANIPALGDFDTTPPAAAPQPPAVRPMQPQQRPAIAPGTATPAAGGQGGAGQGPFPGSAPSSAADLSARLETGKSDWREGIKSISPDAGGSLSYGNYGLNSLSGNSLWDFQREYGEGLGLTAAPNTPQFRAQWQTLVSTPEGQQKARAAEVDWYNRFIKARVPGRMAAAGIPTNLASDPRVLTYFSDRAIQMGPERVVQHEDRVQRAVAASDGDPEKFLAAMSAQDKASVERDFGKFLGGFSDPERRARAKQGLLNRIDWRHEGSLGSPLSPDAPQVAASPELAPPTETDEWRKKWMTGGVDTSTFGGPTTTAAPGATMRQTPGVMAEGVRPEAIEAALGEVRQGPRPPMPPMPPMQSPVPSPQGAMVSAIGGGRAAPQAAPAPTAPAALTGGQPGPVGDFIPPTKGLPPLPKDEQIRALWGSGQPGAKEFAEKLYLQKQMMLQPQQVTNPYTGEVYIGNQYTGYHKSPMPALPHIEKDPLKVAGVETVQRSMYTRGPDGRVYTTPVPSAGAAGAAGAAAGGEGSPEGGMRPLPSTVEGMADWAKDYNAERKSAEVTASKSAEAIFKPVAEAIDAGGKARSVIESLDIMADAYNAGGKNISGGPLGEYVLTAKGAIAQMFGIEPKGLTASNIINKTATQMAGKLTRELSARPALVEFTTYLKNTPGIMMNNQAAKYMISLLRQQEVAKEELGKLAMDVGSKNPRQWSEIKKKYYDEHPIVSPFTGAPLKTSAQAIAEINGAAKGKVDQAAPQDNRPGSKTNPIPVKSLAEAKKLSSGTYITLPDGTPGQVP